MPKPIKHITTGKKYDCISVDELRRLKELETGKLPPQTSGCRTDFRQSNSARCEIKKVATIENLEQCFACLVNFYNVKHTRAYQL